MNKILLVFTIITLICIQSQAQSVDEIARIELSSAEMQAIVLTAKHIELRLDYNEEQKKLSNYIVWVTSSPDFITVSYIAKARAGDEGAKGGNYDYAKSSKYIIDSNKLTISKIVNSR